LKNENKKMIAKLPSAKMPSTNWRKMPRPYQPIEKRGCHPEATQIFNDTLRNLEASATMPTTSHELEGVRLLSSGYMGIALIANKVCSTRQQRRSISFH
jgi:hypothetical protein